MQVPQFPECQHLLVTALSEKTDQELVSLFQMHPTQGKYFVALFCRYSADIYTLIQKDVRSPVQGEYLFSMVWKQIHHELQHLDVADFTVTQKALTHEADDSRSNSSEENSPLAESLEENVLEENSLEENSLEENSSFPSLAKSPPSDGNLRTWLSEITEAYITQTEVPPVESIHYSLVEASPPFLHYLEQSLEHLSPLHRLIVVMAQTFQWRPIRIAAYLRAEGTVLSEAEVEQSLAQGYQALTAALPEDICEIYHLQSVR